MSRDRYLGGCTALREHVGVDVPCCPSCHTDEAEGLSSMPEHYTDEGWYGACCAVVNAAREQL